MGHLHQNKVANATPWTGLPSSLVIPELFNNMFALSLGWHKWLLVNPTGHLRLCCCTVVFHLLPYNKSIRQWSSVFFNCTISFINIRFVASWKFCLTGEVHEWNALRTKSQLLAKKPVSSLLPQQYSHYRWRLFISGCGFYSCGSSSMWILHTCA